jgi:hypothetical protein
MSPKQKECYDISTPTQDGHKIHIATKTFAPVTSASASYPVREEVSSKAQQKTK